MKIVDFHVHAIPPEVMGKAGEHGPEELECTETTRVIRVGNQTASLSPRPLDTEYYEMYIEAQDEAGVSISGLELTPLFYFNWVDAETGAAFTRAANDTLAGYVAAYPDRLFFMATLPMQDIDMALVELRRAVGELGARSVMVGTDSMGGRDLDDPYFYPLWEELVRMDVPVFTHPGPYNVENQSNTDSAKYNYDWFPGYNFRETIAVSHLIFGGVLDEFPGLKVIVPHGGGTVPFLLGKLGRMIGGKVASLGDSRAIRSKRPFEDYLHTNFYFDTFVEDARTLKFVLEVMGPDRVLFGQHTGLKATTADELSKVLAADLSKPDLEKVVSKNAMELFKL